MVIVEIQFNCADSIDIDAVVDALNRLTGAWRMNGQTLGREYPTAINDAGYKLTVMCPAEDALDPRFDNSYVQQSKIALEQ